MTKTSDGGMTHVRVTIQKVLTNIEFSYSIRVLKLIQVEAGRRFALKVHGLEKKRLRKKKCLFTNLPNKNDDNRCKGMRSYEYIGEDSLIGNNTKEMEGEKNEQDMEEVP
jgi:hypothetical protein